MNKNATHRPNPCHRCAALSTSVLLDRCGTDLASPSARRPSRPAFTLIEMLVAVGAVTLIALGVSQVFRATGSTIRAGRRLSNLNAQAALIQRQLQADIAAMTRDGFLLIRNEEIGGTPNPWPDNSLGIKLFNDAHTPTKAPKAKPRRSDELLFFAHGDFTSLRAPEHPSRIPRSTAARIYYGMGLHWDASDPTNYYAPVRIGEHNSAPTTPATLPPSAFTPPALGQPFPSGQTGPNQYAADWILLRHAALLIRPDAEDRMDPPPGPQRAPPFNMNPALGSLEWKDNRNQIALQPAASSPFYCRAWSDPDPAPADAGLVRDTSPFGDTDRPMIGSGVVDIIAMDLGDIRLAIMSAGGMPLTGPVLSFGSSIPTMAYDQYPDNGTVPTAWTHAWMRNALPCNADGHLTNLTLPNQPPTGGRMRCEKQPPNYLVAGPEYRKTDQLMLAASNFVPACTEFMVEWSFGKTYPVNPAIPTLNDGQIIWHGMQRFDSPAGNLTPQPADRKFAEPYKTGMGMDFTVPYRTNNPAQPEGQWTVHEGLIHDATLLSVPPPPQPQPPRLYSYFGYVDPSFQPDVINPGTVDLNDSAQDTVPWAWPSLIRITINLVDPADPSIEQTFQFVFKVPTGTEPVN